MTSSYGQGINREVTMEDNTTTEVSQDTGVENTQPDVQDTATEAVDTTTEQQPQASDNSEPDTSIEVDDTSEWLSKKGIDPSDPEAINKLAKSAREAERAMHAKAAKAKELERSMTELSDQSAEEIAYNTGQDPELLKRVQRFEVKSTVRDFFEQYPEAKQYEQQMIKNMTESGLYGSPEAMLKAAYSMAVAEDTTSVKNQARRETLENLAQSQQASVPRGNATVAGVSSQTITPQNVDQLVAQNNLDWFKKNYDAINRAMSGI
jgi:hypothetical protein